MRFVKIIVCAAIIGSLGGCGGVLGATRSANELPDKPTSMAPSAGLLAMPHRYTVRTPRVETHVRPARSHLLRRR